MSAQAVTNRTAVLTGGGLNASKTVSVGGLPTEATASAEDQSIAAEITARDRDRAERELWRVWIPLVLVVLARSAACAFGGRPRAEQEGTATHGEAHRQGQVSIS